MSPRSSIKTVEQVRDALMSLHDYVSQTFQGKVSALDPHGPGVEAAQEVAVDILDLIAQKIEDLVDTTCELHRSLVGEVRGRK